jgi:hypothetical protein
MLYVFCIFIMLLYIIYTLRFHYLKAHNKVFYHALVRSYVDHKDKEWIYNRDSLEELARYGKVLKYYTSKERVYGLGGRRC